MPEHSVLYAQSNLQIEITIQHHHHPMQQGSIVSKEKQLRKYTISLIGSANAYLHPSRRHLYQLLITLVNLFQYSLQ